VSSKATTPLQSRIQPCSGWVDTRGRRPWSGASALGQAGTWAAGRAHRSLQGQECESIVLHGRSDS
jgi:hypothetical protein